MSHDDFNHELDALREKLPTAVEETAASKTAPQFYSIETAKRIVDYSLQGKSLHWISHQSEMPSYQTLLKWAKTHPEFSKLLRSAREARALHFEESAIREADELSDPKMAGVAKVKADIYWKAAEVNDPATYGKKLAHSGSVDSKVQIQVVTGFGPPNPWQTPPKLREDGTIDKEYEDAKVVESEVVEDGTKDPPESGDAGAV